MALAISEEVILLDQEQTDKILECIKAVIF